MLRKLISLLLWTVGAASLTACSDDPEPDVWQGYTGYRMTSAQVTYYKPSNELHLFQIALEGNGHKAMLYLSTPSIGEELLLPTGSFVFGEMLDGRSTTDDTAVTGGKIIIEKDFLTYTIACDLQTADGKFDGRYIGLIYPPETGDPADLNTYALASEVVPVQVNTSGTYKNTITVKLATDGVTAVYNEQTYSYDFSGNGNYLAVDFICATEVLGPGTYTIASAERAVAGNFVAGYDTTVDWGWGPMQMFNWGSCWFDVNETATTGLHIEKGTIQVKTAAGKYDITGRFTLSDGSAIKATYQGAIGQMQPEDGDETSDNKAPVVEPTKVAVTKLFASQVQNGVVTLKIATDGVTATYNPQTYNYVYTGSGNYISLDMKIADDAAWLPAGTYRIVSNESASTGDCVAGYDTTVDWGWGPMQMFNWGSCWFTIDNGAESGVHIDSGAVKVSIRNSVYTITAEVTTSTGEELIATYTGEIPGMTPDEGGGEGDDKDPSQLVGEVSWTTTQQQDYGNCLFATVFDDTTDNIKTTLVILGTYGDTEFSVDKTYTVDQNWGIGNIGAWQSTIEVAGTAYIITGGTVTLSQNDPGTITVEGSFDTVQSDYTTPGGTQKIAGTFTIKN